MALKIYRTKVALSGRQTHIWKCSNEILPGVDSIPGRINDELLTVQGRSGTCKNCVTCVSQIGNTKANPELEKSRKFVTHLIIFKKSGQTVKFN